MRIRTAHDLAALARGRRLDHGWSQAEAARRAAVSRKWVSDFETGKASVDLAAVLRLLAALDISLSAVEPSSATNAPSTLGMDLDRFLEDYLQR
ncbi:MAG: helix-turn-helix domain-containing protein [Haloechinothrix sp.]